MFAALALNTKITEVSVRDHKFIAINDKIDYSIKTFSWYLIIYIILKFWLTPDFFLEILFQEKNLNHMYYKNPYPLSHIQMCPWPLVSATPPPDVNGLNNISIGDMLHNSSNKANIKKSKLNI